MNATTARTVRTVRLSRAPGFSSMLLGAFGSVLLGAVLGAFYVPAWRLAEAARGWTEATCHIDASGEQPNPGRTHGGRLVVAYHWTVDGHRHDGTCWNFATERIAFLDDRRERGDLASRWAEGSDAPCFVDPADPSQAVLDRELPASFRESGLVLGSVCAGFALLFVSGAWRRMRWRRRVDGIR